MREIIIFAKNDFIKMTFNPDIHHRHSIRLKEYDYSQAGFYFVTVCCQDKICRFGKIENNEMILNEYGKIAYSEWLKTVELRKNVHLHEFVIMPNHIHAILEITNKIETNDSPVGAYCIRPCENIYPCENIRPVKHDNTEHDNTENQNNIENQNIVEKGVCNTPLRSPAQTVGAIIRGYKSAVSRQLGFSVWQRNYYEHIIRDKQSYQKISNYIIHNPLNWKNDEMYMV